jgi:hypothetical protein
MDVLTTAFIAALAFGLGVILAGVLAANSSAERAKAAYAAGLKKGKEDST